VSQRFDAIVFDLLTALIDSWALWNDVAGSEGAGMRWRQAYLKLTYGEGQYRPYEAIVAEAAAVAGLPPEAPLELSRRWKELQPWPEAVAVTDALSRRAKLAVVTNCSVTLGRIAATRVRPSFDVVMTAEEASFCKPMREPYARTLAELGTNPART
jgi:2-haloacid dehalogenase